MNTVIEGRAIIGELPDGSLGIMTYKTDEDYLHYLTHTKQGKPRKLKGKRLIEAFEKYAEFKIEKVRELIV